MESQVRTFKQFIFSFGFWVLFLGFGFFFEFVLLFLDVFGTLVFGFC